MTSLLALLGGTAAGVLHVIAGPDHLAAMAPLVAGDDRGAWRAGLSWGLGHTAGVLLVGVLLVAFRGALPLEALSASSERLVGVAVLVVGLWGLWRARSPHLHAHVSSMPSFAMGTLHGLAGSSHLYGVMPSLMFPSSVDALVYLGGFGAGAVAAMTACSAMLGAAALTAGRSKHGLRQAVLVAASVAAVAVGGVWILG